jgi:lincosamide nucleotidyltransferase B/F
MTLVTPDRLLAGLDAIAATLSTRPQALALLALGSCGVETTRSDAFSDLDFFVIVEESAKQGFIDNLDWLTCGKPLVFAHRNTPDGWKTLDEDGIFCEFAVFHPTELAHIPFAPGRVVWAREDFDVALLHPTKPVDPFDKAWTATEAMTNILVGLKRHLRGEEQAARRAIIGDAAEQVARVLMTGNQADPYNPWRRIEQKDPAVAGELTLALQKARLGDTAKGLMAALARKAALPAALEDEIKRHLELCDAR